jgi:hypothetical protein
VPDAEFREFVEGGAFSAADKKRLLDAENRTATLSEIDWSRDLLAARESWRAIHNYATATRIYLSDPLKSLLSQATALISRILTHAEIARTEEQLNLETTMAWLNQLDRLIAGIEKDMGNEVRRA